MRTTMRVLWAQARSRPEPRRVPAAVPVPAGCRRVRLRAPADGLTGYGQHGVRLALGLEALGWEVELARLEGHSLGPAPAAVAHLARPLPGPARELSLNAPPEPAGGAAPGRVWVTMWESGRWPEGTVAAANACAAVVVPCEWNRTTLDAAGVTVPLHVAPLGLDPALHPPGPSFAARAGPAGVTRYGAGGRTAHGGVRKGLERVVAAWRAAFPRGDEPVALELKAHPDCLLPEAVERAAAADPRVRVLRADWTEAHTAAWYRSLHVFVSGAAAEGFGLMPLQAMAAGCVVVAAIAHGHAEYMTPATVAAVPCRAERAEAAAASWGYRGLWYPPEPEALAAELRRWRAAGRGGPTGERAERLGGRAAARARGFTWERHGAGVAAALAEAG